MKRTDYISWDEYFMGVALLAARPQQGPEHAGRRPAIVSPDNIILSTGYNGLALLLQRRRFFRGEREGAETKVSLCRPRGAERHSECRRPVCCAARGCMWPCSRAMECAKAIIQRHRERSSIFPTNTPKRPTSVPQSACWTPQVCAITLCRRSLPPYTLDFRAPESAGIPQEKATRDEKYILYFSVILCYDITAW